MHAMDKEGSRLIFLSLIFNFDPCKNTFEGNRHVKILDMFVSVSYLVFVSNEYKWILYYPSMRMK